MTNRRDNPNYLRLVSPEEATTEPDLESTKSCLRSVLAYGSLALLTTVVLGAQGVKYVADKLHGDPKPADPARTYIDSFTKDGQCLDGTEFDGDTGIQTFVENRDGQDVLGVRPLNSDGYNYVIEGHPDTLYFVVDADGKVTAKDPHFADVRTAGFLTDNSCDLPSGT